MTPTLGLGLGAAHLRGRGLQPQNNGTPLYLAIGGDSLAQRASTTYPDGLIDTAESFYGNGNVTVEGFYQGGLDTYKTISELNGGTVFFWNDATSAPDSKLTNLISTHITDPAAVNAVALFLGTNDANVTVEAALGGAITRAQYKTALLELCEYLYDTAFPNAEFILIAKFHRNDTSDFAPRTYQMIMEVQQEVIDEVAYVRPMPDIWDVDLDDSVHPTESACEDKIGPRIANACAYYHGLTANPGVNGPQITSAVLMSDHIRATLSHDRGTDITVPANAKYGFRADDDGAALTIDSAARTNATTLKIDLPNQGLNKSSVYKLYTSYGQTPALSRTGAEVTADNAALSLPLRQGLVTVTEADPVRLLTNLEIDINARAGTKTFSSTDVTAITGATAIGATSSSGRYPQYDDTAFGGAGALVAPDGTTHMATNANHTAGSAMLLGMVVEIPASVSGNNDFLALGTSSFGNTNSRLQITTANELKWAQNQSNLFETLATGVLGDKMIILMNFTGTGNVDVYINSATITHSFDPRDSYNDKNRIWFLSRSDVVDGVSGLKLARLFFKPGAHDAVNDPAISTIVNYLNDSYAVGLSL